MASYGRKAIGIEEALLWDEVTCVERRRALQTALALKLKPPLEVQRREPETHTRPPWSYFVSIYDI